MTFYKFIVGFVLTVAMLLVLGASAVLFSVRDFQHGLAEAAPATLGIVDDAKLASADAAVAVIQRSRTTTQLVHGIADLELRGHVSSSTSVAANTASSALGARLEAAAAQPGLTPEDQASVIIMRDQVAQLAALQQQAAATPDAAAADAQQKLSAQLLASSAETQDALLQEYQGYARARTEVAALQRLSPLGIASWLAHSHPTPLSVALVMCMGALGALLYLFPAYLTRPVPVSMAEILVRLIFGAVAAFAFFVIANAGVAAFALSSAQTQAASSSASLNPFTVSLVGIIAGVLAEDIAKWIQDRGRGIFQQGGPGVTQAAEQVGGGLVNNQAIS